MDKIEIRNHEWLETYILNKYATLSECGVLQKIGGSSMLCSICVDYDNPVSEEFLPLSVQYLEKMYAIGKIPQGFIKKEGKASEHEILTSRLIDRSLRPLFPKNFPYPVQITILVMSYDGKTDIFRDAMNLASICLYLSSIPTLNTQVLNAVRVVRLNDADDTIRVCSSLDTLANSKLDLFVSGVSDKITMIEMQSRKTINPQDYKEESNEISEEKLLESIEIARQHIQQASQVYTQALQPFVKEKFTFQTDSYLNKFIKNTIETQYHDDIKKCLKELSKTERQSQLQTLTNKVMQEQDIDKENATKHIHAVKKDIMRSMIFTDNVRADGRTPTQIRNIDIESNLLEYVHGSACFTRGHTQALVTCTLGGQNDAQIQDSIITQSKSKIIFHYNFPPFSVGEAHPIMASSRRELGHGNLALKAIESNVAESPYTIRIVSEILQSNGSSSMASVCGATLALHGAGIAMHNMVAGIAMGLIYESEEKFVVLSDITGLEDFDGDMDFKIAGNEKGFTALQLDIKIDSLSENILQQSIRQAKAGLSHILSLMRAVPIHPNYHLLPQQDSFHVSANHIPSIIGQGGKVIREIIAKFNVSVDINKDNNKVTLIANNRDSLNNAKDYIFEILKKKEARELPYKIDEVYDGNIKKICDFGVFVELPQGGDGLLRTTNNELEIGQSIKVKITAITNGKVELIAIES